MSLTPGQTFNSLKNFVEESFKFRTAEQVYHFLKLLSNASSQNSFWTAKDGQSHLHELVKGNGIVRLADAIRFPKETNRPWSFQRGYIPIFTYIASDWVVKSTLNSDINALYGLIHINFHIIREMIETNMRMLMAARSFREKLQPLSGKQVFKVLFVTIFEYLTRFKEALATNSGIRDFAEQITQWFDEWVAGLTSKSPFQDECVTYSEDQREFVIENLRRDKEQILRLIRRAQAVFVKNNVQMSHQLLGNAAPGLVAALERNFDFDGPGEFCESGPRHDNDHAEFELIRVPPTRDELLCEDEPYLPANFFEGPHFHDPTSMERLLDIQFRLLREELTSPIRLATQLIIEDLKKSKSGATNLSKILDARGGRYAAPATAWESIIFSVFTNVSFRPLELNNRGISAGIDFDTPPGFQETINARWSSRSDMEESHQRCGYLRGQDRVSIRVSFFDAKVNVRIVQTLQNRSNNNGTLILIEAPVFYEGIRPFLEALKQEPESFPFTKYLRLQSKDELTRTTITPPLYSRDPRFSFELKDLFPPTAASLRLITRDPDSIANARAQLIQSSRLDPSQAEAMIDCLTREVALIQGPPRTGKSYTGLELIQVLVKNRIAPILLVAFTNHALDHMLNAILDAGITDKIVEKEEGESRLGYSGKSVYRKMKILESQMKELMDNISARKVPSSHVEQHISTAYPHHHGEFFQHVPAWISAIAPKANDAEEGWETVGESLNQNESIIDFWLRADDFRFLETHRQSGATTKAGPQVSSSNKFKSLTLGTGTNDESSISTKTNRSIDVLLKNPKVWRMSRKERTALYKAWGNETIELTHTIQIQQFEDFKRAHEETAGHHKEITDQLKAELLSRSHIVGCTTTGAAKLVSLLSGMSPKVMIVEEAGQVLEAHILASLVGTVEHMILIGDPLQLRPNINSYKLTTENPKTGKIYKFDQSLMERLSSSGFPMSQINVQRRMRPEISSLIR
ncbi:Helicase required for RNAi-mediated heterochromatin assembly 1 [Schizosaccharomyces pombe 972h-] [Rhizoctonia solani]|uniref:Helicase required for RNAi-mediated heterochromatin assembly 1 [Schizosaccharomyces pombe 972h-] n=1 Tax=Rhizoctonia solani TaxID=456999 RepID=A0A0K6GGW3_9AGAM|nr:Helicase required for RNAi-mediated heterochromatin assembly 1 [Schizosaccharomyces pombe 972h-] [Rhizoctonia solani]